MNRRLFKQKCESILGVSGKIIEQHLRTLEISVNDIMRIDHRTKCEKPAIRIFLSRERRIIWMNKDGEVLYDKTTVLDGPDAPRRSVRSHGRCLPGLDYYDDRRDRRSDGSLVAYEGTFGRYK